MRLFTDRPSIDPYQDHKKEDPYQNKKDLLIKAQAELICSLEDQIKLLNELVSLLRGKGKQND